MTNPKIYAGIGATKTPQDVLNLITLVSAQMSEMNWMLRTGGADGADNAFAEGTANREIHLPWNGYNKLWQSAGRGVHVPCISKEIQEITAAHHPYWDNLSQGAKKLMYRNTTILLGKELEAHAKLVICWTRKDEITGGTGHGMRIASAYGIPVFNLASDRDINDLQEFVNYIENG